MEAVNIHLGALVFDHADYDGDGDVLYLPSTFSSATDDSS